MACQSSASSMQGIIAIVNCDKKIARDVHLIQRAMRAVKRGVPLGKGGASTLITSSESILILRAL